MVLLRSHLCTTILLLPNLQVSVCIFIPDVDPPSLMQDIRVLLCIILMNFTIYCAVTLL